jgi:hypothetical protein
MSHNFPSNRSSSVYSQDSGRDRDPRDDRGYARNPLPGRNSYSSLSSGSGSILIAPPPRSPSSRYSSPSLPSSGSGAPPLRPPPSRGYSPAPRPSSVSSASSDRRPAPPAHASFMSAYGHSSYGRNSNSDRQSPVARLPPASQLSSVHTEFESAAQTSPTRGPPSSPVRPARAPSSAGSYSSDRQARHGSARGSSGLSTAPAARPQAWETAVRDTFLTGVPEHDIDAITRAAKVSSSRRQERRRRQ